jgi:hypothetical protein
VRRQCIARVRRDGYSALAQVGLAQPELLGHHHIVDEGVAKYVHHQTYHIWLSGGTALCEGGAPVKLRRFRSASCSGQFAGSGAETRLWRSQDGYEHRLRAGARDQQMALSNSVMGLHATPGSTSSRQCVYDYDLCVHLRSVRLLSQGKSVSYIFRPKA